jgi:hypothetical protein
LGEGENFTGDWDEGVAGETLAIVGIGEFETEVADIVGPSEVGIGTMLSLGTLIEDPRVGLGSNVGL